MHIWGEKDNQGRDICSRVDDAAQYIANIMRKYGRLFVSQSKEKFGTVRIYMYSSFSFHQLIWPGYHWIHRWWPTRVDDFLIDTLSFIINPIWDKWFKFWYRFAYKQGLKKYPDLREEILCSADYPELLKDL